ncbi:MAG: MBL fold metallo-hydrolase [Rectinema subterraneum]|uniref:MBL fold metallo-hydrolase n=1 Tax=Rectinema subterraneum TaxID=2653714 RepID=UPI003C7AAE43
MRIRIVTLIENSPGEHLALKTEHGISFYIEKENHTIIFDTGQSGAFIQNARKLGINLEDIEMVAISHGHYDHSGGLRHLVDSAHPFELVVGKGFFNKKYATDGISFEYLGNDFDEEYLKEQHISWQYAEKPIGEILPGIFILTNFPRIHEDEKINSRFVIDTGNAFVPDDFSDEISLAVETPRGFIVLVGCSHPGIKNMLDAAASRLPGPIYGVIGGTHLVEASEKSFAASVHYLATSGFKAIGVSHCTGNKGTAELQKSSKVFFRNTTGHALVI